MSNHVSMSEMTQEEHLKAVLYQFITLYERWSEDRQVAAKQGADTAKLVEVFFEQVKHFESLEQNVRQQIIRSIESTGANAMKAIGKEATCAVEDTARQLNTSVEKAQYALQVYHDEVVTTHWKVIGISAFVTIATCFLMVWSLIPTPTLPLTNEQINNMHRGQLAALVWPKLSKKEQQHWQELANQIE